MADRSRPEAAGNRWMATWDEYRSAWNAMLFDEDQQANMHTIQATFRQNTIVTMNSFLWPDVLLSGMPGFQCVNQNNVHSSLSVKRYQVTYQT